MMHLVRFRKVFTAAVGSAVVAGLLGLASPASAATQPPEPYAADLPNLSTPRVAFDLTANQPARGVAARGTDGALLYSARSGSGFAPFQSLGGVIVGDPSAVVTANGTDLFVRGTDNRVYTNTVTPSGGVTGYSVLSGLTVTGEIESIVPRDEPTGSVRLFARGQDGAVWTNVRRNGAWTGWSSLGGVITSDITAGLQLLTVGGNTRIFVRGTDNRVYANRVGPAGASGYQVLGDLRVTSNLTVERDSPFSAQRTLFARGEDNRVYAFSLSVGGATWRPLPAVTATSDIGASTESVYVRTSDNTIQTSRQTDGSGTYSPFERVEGQVTANPAAFTLQPNGGPLTQYLLARQPNGFLAFNIRPFNGIPTGPFAGYNAVPGPAVDG
ncbi:hypothetical protein ACFOY4_38930 [Actinomadura syzygii]|uniref:PLL-like beta propeller domain-containing protein n=1 Tax=Actinomadura syzygii TaxID=1427538 RepID=A0A5D0U9B0_9ACTN|nr:hypothetical protein [Actinomadura syzygii]TYC14350.1 hypothetical protein FXF65_15925 [Actinomadura syzygii]